MSLSSRPVIITVNGGSSSIKVSLAVNCATSTDIDSRIFSATLDRLGASHAILTTHAPTTLSAHTQSLPNPTFDASLAAIINALKAAIGTSPISGIGHRIVHGGTSLLEHQLITPVVLATLKEAQPLDLDHLPREIALIEGFSAAFAGIPQVACFDTAFHRDMPRVAQLLPIPRRYYLAGLRRFGFHGLSYTSLMQQLAAIAGPEVANGRVILAHLGAGASMAAVSGGKPIDTTMSFTPLSGLVMATRPGDLDPGLLCYLLSTLGATDTPQHLAARLNHTLSTDCGLLGVSELSGDMRDLLAARDSNPQAAEAIDLFCRTSRKHLCALAGEMGGFDTIVFSGGIGEHSPQVRTAICGGLAFLGVILDPTRNAQGHALISAPSAPIQVYVLPTSEEAVIVQIVRALVGTEGTSQRPSVSHLHADRQDPGSFSATLSPSRLGDERASAPVLPGDACVGHHPHTITEAKEAWRNEGNPN